MLHEYFRETQDEHHVSNRDLADEAGVSTKHLSLFRNGKANITLDVLWKLVESLDRLSPGAKKDFGLKLAGSGCGIDLEDLLGSMPPSELLQIIGHQRFAALVNAFAESVESRPEMMAGLENSPDSPRSLRNSTRAGDTRKSYDMVS